MADFTFNIAKGRVAELYNRVDSNDPANSALVVVAIVANGATDAALKDLADLTAVLATAANEATNAGYARLVLTDADLAALTVDNVNDRMPAAVAALSFGAITAGDNWTDLLIGYDSDTTSGTDANIIPLTFHDFPITTDGSVVSVTAGDFFRAT